MLNWYKNEEWFKSLSAEQREELSFFLWLGLHLAPVNLLFAACFWKAIGVI